jgi:uncharacterized protein YdeI (YjbR/CyaY-like superfamily)
MDDLPTLRFSTRQAWEDWLETNHASAAGAWLELAKKGSPESTVSRPEALEVALCYGWIDGQAVSIDGNFWKQRFTPRARRSRWSRINREAASRLIQAGRMKPSGVAQVEAARRDGRWDAAYDSPRSMVAPEDFLRRLDEHPRARAFFDELDSGNRYAILYRIQDAKQPLTRARRIEKYVTMLRERRTIHP